MSRKVINALYKIADGKATLPVAAVDNDLFAKLVKANEEARERKKDKLPYALQKPDGRGPVTGVLSQVLDTTTEALEDDWKNMLWPYLVVSGADRLGTYWKSRKGSTNYNRPIDIVDDPVTGKTERGRYLTNADQAVDEIHLLGKGKPKYNKNGTLIGFGPRKTPDATTAAIGKNVGLSVEEMQLLGDKIAKGTLPADKPIFDPKVIPAPKWYEIGKRFSRWNKGSRLFTENKGKGGPVGVKTSPNLRMTRMDAIKDFFWGSTNLGHGARIASVAAPFLESAIRHWDDAASDAQADEK